MRKGINQNLAWVLSFVFSAAIFTLVVYLLVERATTKEREISKEIHSPGGWRDKMPKEEDNKKDENKMYPEEPAQGGDHGAINRDDGNRLAMVKKKA